MKFKVSSKQKATPAIVPTSVSANFSNNNPEYSSPNRMINANVPIPEMAALVIGNQNVQEQNFQIPNNSTNPPIQIPDQQTKATLSVVDESIPRQCDYLGSFEVRHFSNPEDRGNYITQQLYVICKQQDVEANNNSLAENSDQSCSFEESNNELNENIQGDINLSGSTNDSTSDISVPARNGSDLGSSSPSRRQSGHTPKPVADTQTNEPKTWPVCLVLRIAGIKV
jgi:hypothetical protein